jgi:NAD(P)-dependent dehydrogenase (short-subunit alcohol dehydrogenase family)
LVDRLKGKVALITGAGSGVGRAASVIFAKEGAKVVLTDIRPEVHIAEEVRHLYRPEDSIKLVREAGGEGIYVEADLAKEEEVKKVIKAVVDTYGMLDVMFINHGLGFSARYPMTRITETDMADWDAIVNVNLRSHAMCLKYGIPHMKEGGSVVITSSISGMYATPGYDHYSAAKGGLIALTRSVAIEYAPKIRVNVILPGGIDSPMLAPLWKVVDKKQIEQANPLKRLAKPEDIAYMALFLASDEAAYITGQIFIVDGGATAL